MYKTIFLLIIIHQVLILISEINKKQYERYGLCILENLQYIDKMFARFREKRSPVSGHTLQIQLQPGKISDHILYIEPIRGSFCR